MPKLCYYIQKFTNSKSRMDVLALSTDWNYVYTTSNIASHKMEFWLCYSNLKSTQTWS
jgi:hypothetical protein